MMNSAALVSKTGPLARIVRSVVPRGLRPIGYLTFLVQRRTRLRVLKGPFAGMRYVSNSIGSAYLPKLLGIYERELVDAVESMCTGCHALIVDIGAAEGYYAVGLALRNPQARVVAFEMEQRGRDALREMARLNAVDGQVTVKGRCEADDLKLTLAGTENALVVCDVEGYEGCLLDPAAIPELKRSTILAETHDFIQNGITESLRRRFEATHRIQIIWQQRRRRQDFPWRTLGTALLPRSCLEWAVSEWRPALMSWLWMQPRPPTGA